MCLYIYMYICICIYVYIHICICIYLNISISMPQTPNAGQESTGGGQQGGGESLFASITRLTMSGGSKKHRASTSGEDTKSTRDAKSIEGAGNSNVSNGSHSKSNGSNRSRGGPLPAGGGPVPVQVVKPLVLLWREFTFSVNSLLA